MIIRSRKNIFHVRPGPARPEPGGPVGLNCQSKEMMDCGVSKATIYHPEPDYDDRSQKIGPPAGHLVSLEIEEILA